MKRKNARAKQVSVRALVLFVIAVLFVALPQGAKGQYQPPESSLKLMKWDGDTTRFSNPESVKVDSSFDSPTYRQLLLKIFSKI